MNDQGLDAAVCAKDRIRERRRRSGPEWRDLIAQQESGEMTVEAFCDEHGLRLSSFLAWRRRFRRAAGSGTGGLVEVRARADGSSDVPQGSEGVLEVRFGSATLLAPLTSLGDVVAALSREMQQPC